MRNYIAMVFDDTSKAYGALRDLWKLDDEGEITVHGSVVVHRNAWGEFQVDTKETSPALATAVGVGVGALLGALMGPAGAAIGAVGGAAIGAALGGAIGAVRQLGRAEGRDLAVVETEFALQCGQSAVIADVSEHGARALDARLGKLGAVISRRDWNTIQRAGGTHEYSPGSYLYPYEFVPQRYATKPPPQNHSTHTPIA